MIVNPTTCVTCHVTQVQTYGLDKIAVWCNCPSSRMYGGTKAVIDQWNAKQRHKEKNQMDCRDAYIYAKYGPPPATSTLGEAYMVKTPREQLLGAVQTLYDLLYPKHEPCIHSIKYLTSLIDQKYPPPRELRVYRIWSDTNQRYVETRYNPDREQFEWRYPGHDMSWCRNKPDHEGWCKCERVDVNALYLKENPYV